jgi:FkbM family methyltransferase
MLCFVRMTLGRSLKSRVKSFLRTLGEQMQPEQRPAIYLGDHTLVTKTLDGHMLYLDTRDRSLTPTLLMHGRWERRVSAVLARVLKPGMRAVEVGANIGAHTIEIAELVGPTGHVTAFEANPRTADLLRTNLDVNGLLERCEVRVEAAGDRSGTITFYGLATHHGSSSTIAFDADFLARIGDRATEIQAPCTRVDDVVSGRVDLIKIDAEGSEPFVFDGMTETIRRNPAVQILCEFNPSLLRRAQREPREFLQARMAEGFVLRVITPDGAIEPATADALLSADRNTLWSTDHELFLSRS